MDRLVLVHKTKYCCTVNGPSLNNGCKRRSRNVSRTTKRSSKGNQRSAEVIIVCDVNLGSVFGADKNTDKNTGKVMFVHLTRALSSLHTMVSLPSSVYMYSQMDGCPTGTSDRPRSGAARLCCGTCLQVAADFKLAVHVADGRWTWSMVAYCCAGS